LAQLKLCAVALNIQGNRPLPTVAVLFAECLTAALESWERDVVDTYGALSKHVSDDELKSFAAGQKNWSEYRDREFDFINELFKNQRGTMYVPRRLSYRIEVVKARALELEKYLHEARRLKGLEN
jgi:uncharacterized protein YecT (DUF1311 family)